MNKMLLGLFLLLPLPALADHMDVIEFELNEGCSFAEYMEIVDDFNSSWGKQHGYETQIAAPLQSSNLVHMYWLGRTADAEAFGKAWDAWRDALDDPDTTAAKLWARFQKCETNLGRRSYDIY